MSMNGRTIVALAGALLVIAIATWFDNTFMLAARRDAAAHFDTRGVGLVIAAGSLLVAGSALIMWVLAWRARSVAVGLTYAMVGGFFVLLPWLVWNFAAETNGAPPVLPEPLLTVISQIYFRTGSGPLNAVGTIGAAMLIAGVAGLVRWQRDPGFAKRGDEAMARGTGPAL